MTRRNPRAGVTLLELLIALWVMAAAAMILASSMGLIGRAMGRVGFEVADVDRITARVVLRRWLEEMPEGASLAGDGQGMRFGTLIDQPPLTAAVVTEVRVGTEEGAVRAVAGEGAVVAVLSPAGSITAIRYFGAANGRGAPVWRGDWPEGAEALPQLVRIDYAEDGREMPPLSVIPARIARQSEMSPSSPVPPG